MSIPSEHQQYMERFRYEPSANVSRMKYDIAARGSTASFDTFWASRESRKIPETALTSGKPLWMEIGAGSGQFFVELARLHPDRYFIAIERSRDRGSRLVKRAEQSGLDNVLGVRGNAVAAVMKQLPEASVERFYFMYPCPYPRNSQRLNRWYLHPAMPHYFRALQPGGRIVWASDQEFFIQEAKWVLESVYGMKTLVCGEVTPNAHNHLESFPGGRTKFERTFLESGLPCFELISEKPLERGQSTFKL